LPPEERKSWVYQSRDDGNTFNDKDSRQLYIFAVYWILETITTVGYGDYTGGTRNEYLFTMVLEVIISIL